MGFNSFFNDNNFFERIRNSHQRILLLQHFFLIRNGKCRLNIITLIRLIANKIYFRLNSHRFAVFVFTVFNDAYVNVESHYFKFVIDNIFHNMSFFVLTEVKPRVSQADIGVVIFRRSIDIFFPFNIVAFCLRNQIGIAQIFEIMIDCVGMK